MKLLRVLVLFLLPSLALHAQDTTVIKRQATLMAQATFKGDHKTIIAYTYPKLVELSGGPEQMQKLITERVDALKKQGILSFEGTIGSPGKFYEAGTETHCLLPEEIIIKTSYGRFLSRSYMLGVSNDKGKNWTFLDVGNMPPDVLHRLLPNLSAEIIIPPPAKPEFLGN
jgi:hypothetical protein